MGKKFSMNEYDEGTLESYQDGFLAGMLQAHGIASATVQSLIVSINDVLNLYENKYDGDPYLPMFKHALTKVMSEMDKNYLAGVKDIKVEFGLEDEDWEDLT